MNKPGMIVRICTVVANSKVSSNFNIIYNKKIKKGRFKKMTKEERAKLLEEGKTEVEISQLEAI